MSSTQIAHPSSAALAVRSSSSEPALVRAEHARARQPFAQPAEEVLDAFSAWAGYERWAPAVQGPAHWLTIRAGGPGSRFVLYDKPGGRHLAQFGVVTHLDRGRRFAWRAPFGEWPRAWVGSEVEAAPDGAGGCAVTETLFFEADEEDLPALAGFLSMPGFDADTCTGFLCARLAGLATLLDAGELAETERGFQFAEDRQVAADWAGRIPEGGWVRVLHADGELDFDASPQMVFNAFTRFALYPEWTRAIHVGCEWLDVQAGGVGSRFLLWEKPGGRQVMHQAVVTECEPEALFTWRAPFAEWGKVLIGTSMRLEPRADGGTHAYHVLYTDLPYEYLPVFAGFGALHGFDLEFETLHIHEEAAGFARLLRDGAFTAEDRSFLFDRDQAIARTWPLQDGRPWPDETLTLQPDRTITFEELSVEVAHTLADAVPSPAFLRRYRDLARTRAWNAGWGERA